MKVKDYEAFVISCARMGLDNDAYNVVGLCGEAGEVAEWFKKAVFRTQSGAYGPPSDLTEDDLLNELGDVIHYVTRICLRYNWSLKDCMQANHDKLKARWAKNGKL